MSSAACANTEPFETKQIDGVTVIIVVGDIDSDGETRLLFTFIQCIQKNQFQIVVDLKEMRFISDEGVGVLMEGLHQLHARGGDLKLNNVNLYAKRLFRLCHVHLLLKTFASKEEAIASFG